MRLRDLSPGPSPAPGGAHEGRSIIVVRDLTKRFGPVTAIENLSFTVKAGEAVALWGPNGAGKSTVLHCLLGVVRYEGSLRLVSTSHAAMGKKCGA
jgi:ABC-type multidrug transport system ATPase subunit